ncbi:apolipo L4 [Solea senegalensis]|uniref:Apolipo L4 n=1 Tax=Solea senegalensis TaxID=28829 RepID=A0AAV6RI01_SOLSE|nr:apolipo L4 [Solea senegalensis]
MVRGFCDMSSKWLLRRETELNMMTDIKKREELAAVMEDTREGLAKLDPFLDALEKLAVTSPHVFTHNRVLVFPEGTSFECVEVIINAARQLCPLLLEFKRDAQVFFMPKLQNVEVLAYQLEKYIQTTQKICATLKKRFLSDFKLKTMDETVVNLPVDVSEDDVRRMLDHVNQLDEIRMNEHFRMVFLFQGESCDTFISEFSKRHPTMVQSLQDLEDVAVQLDRMNKGAKISSVTGSSVGAIGGVLSIVGLALIPVTAGLSLGLTATGLGLGITSGVNSAVTTATEIGVNAKQQNKAKEVFQRFMEDVQSLQGCLDDVTNETLSKMEKDLIDLAEGVDGVLNNDKLNKEVIAGVGKVVAEEGRALLNVPRLVSDIPDIGQAAAKGSLALSKSARAGLIGLNALFIGMDVFFICKDSISLAKGTETEVSQFIRARAALWSSEVEAFQRMRDSLCKGQPTSEKNEALLETPYYPDSCTNNKEI